MPSFPGERAGDRSLRCVMRHGVFPGSFDPLTVAHLALADAAREQCALARLDLVISHVPLAKEHRAQAPVSERIAAIDRHRDDRPWLAGATTDHQLLVDIAAGYDVLVVGADKWHQLHDPDFYGGSASRMRDALARLPILAVAPRAGHEVPAHAEVVILEVDERWHHVSSTAVREGRHDWRA